MKFEDLKQLYLEKRRTLGDATYRHISELLTEAKQIHYRDWQENPTRGGDHEQSWRAFKGKNLEKLIQFMIEDMIKQDLPDLRVINGNRLERSTRLSEELSQVKRNLAIDYGKFGLHLPDVDIIVYHHKSYKVLAVFSSKVTLRERIAQTGYWKLKLLNDDITRHIKVYFVTPDEDGTLTHREPPKKGRAIVETDLDGSYVLTQEEIEESSKVKLFEHLLDDLKSLARATRD